VILLSGRVVSQDIEKPKTTEKTSMIGNASHMSSMTRCLKPLTE
jgi:hypothetical protein